jgi:hypothetical protein
LFLFGNTRYCQSFKPSSHSKPTKIIPETTVKMHAFTAFFTVATLFTSALSTPLAPARRWQSFRDYNHGMSSCLQPANVEHLVTGFALLVNSTFDPALSADILSVDFTDFSDSINFLTGQTPGSPTFTSLSEFNVGQGGQPPVPLEILAVEAVTCDTVAFRWLAYPGPLSVKGITIFNAIKANGTSDGWQIKTQYAEFNVAAWTIDTPGGSCTPPPPPPSDQVPHTARRSIY